MLRTHSARFTEGPLFSRLFFYSVPIMLTGILQLLFSAADQLVVGRFSGDNAALGAVGSTGTLSSLIVNFLLGVSIGSSVVIAQAYGAKKEDEVSNAVHTSLTFYFLGGLLMLAVGLLVTEPALVLMGTKDVFLERAVLYLKIICLGIPASAVFNFGATILRSTGDSRTPLIILAITGLANVALNLVFVIGMKMSVEGVALATVISQYLSAIWVIYKLAKSNDCFRFRFSRIGINGASLRRILVIGLPSGIQSSLFSISNVTIQTAANTFAPEVISANAICSTVEGFTYTTMHSYQQTAITFTGQNYGAGKPDRVRKALLYALLQVTVVGVLVGYVEILFGHELCSIFIDPTDPARSAILDAAQLRLWVMLGTYFTCGIMEVMSGYLRGLGHSIVTMICSLTGACLLRIVWVSFIFPLEPFNNPVGLYMSYPVTWVITVLAMLIFAVYYDKKDCNKSKL